MDNTQTIRSKLGFPDAATFRGIVASTLGECVVVLVRVAADPPHQDRLYVRHFASSTYRQIAWPEGCNSFDLPVVSHAAPELFVLGRRWSEIPAAGGAPRNPPLRGADPAGIYRIRLPDGDAELLHPAQHPPVRGAASLATEVPWCVSDLLGMTPDGTRFIVQRGRGIAVPNSVTWAYSIAELDPITGALLDLTELPAVFA